MKARLFILPLLFAFLLSACDKAATNDFVRVENGKFMTSHNQELFLKAINVVNKQKEDNYVPHHTSEVYKAIRDNGYNSIRLGVNWGGLEPQPLQYDEAYLQMLDEQIMLIKEQGLYIVLDMHQDLYGVKFGGGAPMWAVLDDGKEHTTGEVWSEAYYLSAAVQTSFDNFWDNKIVEQSGIGLQEHYARGWQILAKRYANETAIVGFDIMNEPFAGSDGSIAMRAMFVKLTEIDNNFTIEKILKALSTPEGTLEILTKLSDLNVYRQVISASEPIYQNFEETRLQTFYQHVADSIRTASSEHVLFLEPSVSANNGVLSIIAPTKLKSGEADSQVAFAAHLYDIVLDTELAYTASGDRLSFILAQITKAAERYNMPIFVGEWGAFYGSNDCSPVAKHYTKMFEDKIISNAYWSYSDGLWDLSYFQTMNTIYPQKIGGEFISVNHADKKTIITWKAKNKCETIIYIPNVDSIDSITGDNLLYSTTAYAGSKSGFVTVVGEAIDRELEITINLK